LIGLKIRTFTAICLFASPVLGWGGSQQISYVDGYSFRDIVNCPSYGQNYCWKSIQAVSSNRLEFTSSISRTPFGAIKVTVNSGDDPISSTGERAETLWMFSTAGAPDDDEGISSGTKFYATSIYIPEGFQSPSSWGIVLQLHGPNAYGGTAAGSPNFALDITGGNYHLEQRGGDKDNPTITTHSLGAISYNTWVDFVFEVTWESSAEAAINVWTRANSAGALQQRYVSADNNGSSLSGWMAPNLYSESGVPQTGYWKRGFYRSEEAFTNILYLSTLCRADNLKDAATCAFGSN